MYVCVYLRKNQNLMSGENKCFVMHIKREIDYALSHNNSNNKTKKKNNGGAATQAQTYRHAVLAPHGV